MIKFFRKIRQKLLTENKLSRYLLYAIGEIILVVIGILIALYINNLNEKQKTEEKVNLVFEELMDELGSNIATIKRRGLFYKRKDSLTYLVLNTNISKEHYKTHVNDFRLITNTTRRINLSHNAYDKLVQMSEFIPLKYNDLMEGLHQLNNTKLYVDYMDNRFHELVEEIIDYQVYNYSWQVNNDIDELINFLYSDPKFKADVIRVSQVGNNEQYESAIRYLESAVDLYKDIAQLLQKPIDYGLIGYTSPMMDDLVGDWITDQDPDFIATIYKENNQLYAKNNLESQIGKFYFLTEDKIIVTPGRAFLSVIENDGKTVIHNSTNGLLFEKKEPNK